MLLKGGCVLSLDRRVGNLTTGDVLVEDDRITEVGSGLRARDAEVVDATDTIVMPGFVDTHRRTWTTLLRNLGEGTTSKQPVQAYGRHHEPDDVYAATLIGLLGAVETGVTTVVDWSDIQVDSRYTEAVLQAHADAGLRTILVHAEPEWIDAAEVDGGAATLRLLAAERTGPASNGAPLTTVAVGAGPVTRSAAGDAVSRWELGRELGLRIHAPAGTDPADRGVLAEFAARGLLRADVTLVHTSHLGDDDLDAIASHDVAVSLAPSSEMALGLGTPPLQPLIDRGIRPGLGVGDELLAPGDLFAQMRAVQSLQHATVFDLKLAGKAGLPHLLTTREVIRYATVDGARTAGLAESTGSLAPGMQADIVLLRTDRPNIHPVNDPIGAVVWGMDPSNVDWVFVAGRPLVRAGELQADVGLVRDLATTARHRIAGAAGDLVESREGGPR